MRRQAVCFGSGHSGTPLWVAVEVARAFLGPRWRTHTGVEPLVDSTLVKAIARAFRWQKLLETGRYTTIREIANAERINPSYVSRVLRLTLLAPATVEAILDGRASAGPTLAEAMGVFPVVWKMQSGRRHLPSDS